MAWEPDAPRAQAQSLGHDLVDQAQRDGQSTLGAQDFGQVAVECVVVVVLVADEFFFFEEDIMKVREQSLWLAAANARANVIDKTLQRRIDFSEADAFELVHRDG